MPRTNDDLRVLNNMKRYGGGFASKLAEAGLHADDANLEKIKIAFSEYWSTYSQQIWNADHNKGLEDFYMDPNRVEFGD